MFRGMFYGGLICYVIFFLLSVVCFIRNNVAQAIRNLAGGRTRKVWHGGKERKKERYRGRTKRGITRLLILNMLLGMLAADSTAAQEAVTEPVEGYLEEVQAPVIKISGIQEQYTDEEGKYFCNQTQQLLVSVEGAGLEVEKCRVSVFRDKEDDSRWGDVEWSAEEENPCLYQTEISLVQEGEYEVSVEAETIDGVKEWKTCQLIVDKTAPEIFDIRYYDVDGLVEKRYGNIYGNRMIRMEFAVEDRYSGVMTESVYITTDKDTVQPEGTENYPVHRSEGNRYYVYIPMASEVSEFDDTVTIWAQDMLGNQGSINADRIIYSTGVPSIKMACNKDFSLWTNEDITFHTTVSDYAAGLKEVVYIVNKKVVKRVKFDRPVYTYSWDVTAAENAKEVIGYTVEVEAINNCGSSNRIHRRVYVDKEKPKVRFYGVQEGMHYNTDQTLTAEVSDVSYAGTTMEYVIKRRRGGRMDTIPVAGLSMETYSDSCSYKLSEEGEYSVYILVTDGAGNQTVSDTLEFVIDKTPPKLSISGVKDGSMNNSAVTVRFICEEAYPVSDRISINVERSIDGHREEKQMGGFVPDGETSSLQHTFVQDGTYEVTFSAVDRAGNQAESGTIRFFIDGTPPKLSIIGTANYQQWSREVTVYFGVEESYYRENRVTITGTRRDIDERVTRLSFPQMANIGKNSSLSHLFSKEGIYHLEIHSIDGAGNRADKEIHFAIDRTAPQIDGIEAYQGGYYQQFRLADRLDEIFKDLTVISCRILLNGEEYNETETITQEGKYNLYVEAEDELGHRSSKSVEFIIDHTAPKVIFTGVKDGEKVYEGGSVTWALANAEDKITGVRINGVEYDSDTKILDYSEYGIYRIEIDCADKAGNTATRTLDFTYGRSTLGTLVVGMIGILVAIIGIRMFIRLADCRKG